MMAYLFNGFLMGRLMGIPLSVFQLYDPPRTGRLSLASFEEVATRCLAMCREEAQNTFQQADLDEKGYITYGKYYFMTRPVPADYH